MVGQGSPKTSLSGRQFADGCRSPATLLAGWAVALLLGLVSPAVAAEEFQLRVSWGGQVARTWQGSIWVSEGEVSAPAPLGIEADEPGSMWLDEGQLLIRQRSPRSYD